MNLFICYSPLQVKIALQIISHQKIEKYDVFFFTHRDTIKNRLYYESISSKANSSIYYVVEDRFPFYVSRIRKIFKNLVYDRVYLASIDNIFPQLVLSVIKYNDIATFDDGSANIFYNSLYYNDNRTLMQKIAYFIVGSRFTLEKIKKVSVVHYTIYKDRENIIDNLVFIDLFNIDEVSNEDNDGYLIKYSECNVLLGTFYRYVTDFEEKVKSNLSDTFLKYDNFIFIPHPMEPNENIKCMNLAVDSDLIAEDIIISLMKKYKKINLYGIASSALIPFVDCEWCNVYTIKSKLFSNECNELSDNLIFLGINAFDLDETEL